MQSEARVSAETPDWSREAPRRFWDPSRRLLAAIRGHAKSGWLGRKRWALSHRFWSAVTSCDIPLGSDVAGGLLLPHATGIVMHPAAHVGPNCLIFQNVTLGTVEGKTGAPTLEGHVDVGAGAVILGPVTIGAHAVIGANAVVAKDVPAGGVFAGNPGRLIRVDRARAGLPPAG